MSDLNVFEWAGEGGSLIGDATTGNEEMSEWRKSVGAKDPVKVGDPVLQYTVVSDSSTTVWPACLAGGFNYKLRAGTYASETAWLNSLSLTKPLQEYEEDYTCVSSINDPVPSSPTLSQIFEIKDSSTQVGFVWQIMDSNGDAWELNGLVSGTTLPFMKTVGKQYDFDAIDMSTVTVKPTIEQTFDNFLQSQGTYPNTYYFSGSWQFVKTIKT